jgi:hypothetical protein
MYRAINNAFHHHCQATPIEQVGRWHIYHTEDVAADWPGNGVRLAVAVTTEQVEWLRVNDKPGDFDPLPLPTNEPPPEEEDPQPQPEEDAGLES